MEHVSLEIAFLTIVGVVLLSKAINVYFKIPLPHSFIVFFYTIYFFAPDLLNIKANENFDKILFMLIPLILTIDALLLKWKYIKEFYASIIYLAVFSVAISIAIGASLYSFQLLGPGMTIGMYVALFSIVMATDAISVSNIFSQFNVPHNIKVLTEGESLGNDATAMIAFFFVGLPWIANGSFDLTTIPWIATKIFLISGIIGLIIGYLGYLLMKLFDDEKEELLITIAVSYGAFVSAELFHVAGIFSLITSIILFKTLIDHDLKEAKEDFIEDLKTSSKVLRKLKLVKKAATTKAKHENTIMNLENFSYIAVAIVFASIADLIEIKTLLSYWKEIMIMFIVTTIIRAIIMAKFVLIGKNIKAIDYVGFNGWVILTLAGMKGALSIIMIHALPKDFIFLEMFEAITVGLILLSIFVYGFLLLFYMIFTEKKEVTSLSH